MKTRVISIVALTIANVVLVFSNMGARHRWLEESQKRIRYEHYLTCITHGQAFVMDPQDTWIVEPGAHDVKIQPSKPKGQPL